MTKSEDGKAMPQFPQNASRLGVWRHLDLAGGLAVELVFVRPDRDYEDVHQHDDNKVQLFARGFVRVSGLRSPVYGLRSTVYSPDGTKTAA